MITTKSYYAFHNANISLSVTRVIAREDGTGRGGKTHSPHPLHFFLLLHPLFFEQRDFRGEFTALAGLLTKP